MFRVCQYNKNASGNIYDRRVLDYNLDIFDNCRKINLQDKSSYVFVAKSFDNELFFVFDDGDDSYLKNVYTTQLESLCTDELIAFRDIYPDKDGIRLYGVNELSLKLFFYLNTKKIYNELIGNEWKILGPNATILSEKTNVKNILEIYADENDFYEKTSKETWSFKRKPIILSTYGFINSKLIHHNYLAAMKNNYNRLKDDGCSVGFVNIPDLDELDYLSEDELFCINNEITLYAYATSVLKDENILNALINVYGEEHVEQYLRGNTTQNRITHAHFGCTFYTSIEEERESYCYLLGPCIAWQGDLQSEDTIVSLLQSKMDIFYGGKYKVVGVSVATEYFYLIEKVLNNIFYRSDDIFLFIHTGLTSQVGQDDRLLNLKELFDKRDTRYFSNHPLHMNQLCSNLVAEELSLYIKNSVIEEHGTNRICNYPKLLDEDEKRLVEEYFRDIEDNYSYKEKKGSVGAIVMNCNPYTRGHDYLIQEAKSQVDNLIIFVVEENKSEVDFIDRYAIVNNNIEKYENVEALPSGNMVLSSITLPTYFLKDEFKDAKVNADDDLKIFALGIAPKYRITKRFVGEEPIDKVTAQYNQQMKDILPHYGVEVVEIPRLMTDGEVVSASLVRKKIKEGNIEAAAKYLTPETLEYVLSKNIISEKKDRNGITLINSKEELISVIVKQKGKLIIYGAGKVANAVLGLIQGLNLQFNEIHIVVSNLEDNKKELCGVKVEEAKKCFENNPHSMVIVSAHSRINKMMILQARRYMNNVCLISDYLCDLLTI